MVLKIVDCSGKPSSIRMRSLDLSALTPAEAAELAGLIEQSRQASPARGGDGATGEGEAGFPGKPRARAGQQACAAVATRRRGRHHDKGSSPLQVAFIERAIGAIERISKQADEATLVAALSAPTDVGGLARVLGDVDAVGAASLELDPFAAALARNAVHRAELIKTAGGTLSADEAGQVLGMTRQGVDKRRSAGRLLAVRQAGDWRYPAFQFADGEPSGALLEVVKCFDDRSGWGVLAFLLTPDSVLEDRTPFNVLRSDPDGLDRVQRLARARRGDGFA